MNAAQAAAACKAMCAKCSNANYVPGPGDLPHCGWSCESTVGYEDIILTERDRRKELQRKFRGVDQ